VRYDTPLEKAIARKVIRMILGIHDKLEVSMLGDFLSPTERSGPKHWGVNHYDASTGHYETVVTTTLYASLDIHAIAYSLHVSAPFDTSRLCDGL
jgi:hypothetical protein